MLISITLENWKSFRNPTKLSMVASSDNDHAARLSHNKTYGFNLLPVTAIYGSNGSGKSNFLTGVVYALRIINGSLPIKRAQPYKLDSSFKKKPSKFTFEILINEKVYEYSFSVLSKKIIEEKLTLINEEGTETNLLYTESHSSSIKINNNFFSLGEEEGKGFIKGLLKTKQNDILLLNFLNKVVDKTSSELDKIRKLLTEIEIISPYTFPTRLMKEPDSDKLNELSVFLENSDSGISAITTRDTPIMELGLPSVLLDEITSNNESMPKVTNLITNMMGISGEIIKTNKGLVSRKIQTIHKGKKGKKIEFDLEEESDGTRRLFSIGPSLLKLFSNTTKNQIILVDELDRSLHSLLTRWLIETYLKSCDKKSKKQLIFTTHDIDLLDRSLLRRDEIWITKRNEEGTSKLVSLVEFSDIEKNEDIRGSYITGRFGGLPNIKKVI